MQMSVRKETGEGRDGSSDATSENGCSISVYTISDSFYTRSQIKSNLISEPQRGYRQKQKVG